MVVKFFSCKTGIFEKWTNTICGRKIKKNAYFRCNYLFLENGIFLAYKITKHYKIWGFQQAQGKTQNGTFGFKSAILGFPLERVFHYLWYTKAVFCWKHYFMVLSAQHSFAEIKECKLKKHKFTKIGVGCQHAKGVFFHFLFFDSFVFFIIFVFLFFWKQPPKGYFPVISELFSFFVSPRGLWNPSFYILFCFLVSFCPPFQNSIIFLWLLSINPFFEKKKNIYIYVYIYIYIFVFFFCLFLPLPLFLFAFFFKQIS